MQSDMKKIITMLLVLTFFVGSLASTGCGRQPTSTKSRKIMTKFFEKYAKKYPDSIIGKYPVEDVNVLHSEEIHKGVVVVYAILNLDNGMPIQTRFTIRKKPLGWKAVSWENMGMAQRTPTKSTQPAE